MNEPVAAVDSNGQEPDRRQPKGPRPTEVGDASSPVDQGARFTYPSGARPLEGFTIKRGIGHGGFGEVYYATSDAGKEVALKLIRRNLDVELRGIRQCLNLKHPNLLSVFDIREDKQGDKWVVMEYVTGNCLEDVLAVHPDGLPIQDALAWIHGIGAGVACLHDHGIVHRDLKPGNIFSDEGLVKIGDYGLSKFISCSRRSGQTESVGTVHYMAPEVANGRYGKEIDVYALGIILYEILTGRVPFEGESVGEVLMKHLTAKPDVSMLAEPYRSVVARALEKDPTRRFRSAGQMLAKLPKPDQPEVYVGPIPSRGRTSDSGGTAGGPSPFAATATPHGPAGEEPILRALRQFIENLYHAWNQSTLNTPTKIILLAIALVAFLMLSQMLVPLAVVLLMLYGCYWLVRMMVVTVQTRPRQAAGQPVASPFPPAGPAGRPIPPAAVPPKAAARFVRRPRWAPREAPADALVLKPPKERLTELVGSMLGGALVAVTTCLVMAILVSLGSNKVFSVEDYARCGWVVLMSVIGTWAVLIPSKFWEGSRGDAMLRRFIMMVLGLALGLVAVAAAGALMADLPHDFGFPELMLRDLTGQKPANLHAELAGSEMKYYLAAFGCLFLFVRWWRQADPLRTTRLSLWWMFVCAVVAALVAEGCGFPQPWLIMVACAVSISVQLASPWVHPRQRTPRKNPP